MDYFDAYKKRLSLEKGNKQAIDSSIQHLNRNFSDTLFADSVSVDGQLTEVIVTQGKNSHSKSILFKPNVKINVGSLVVINSKNYLTMDFQGEGIHEVYPTAYVQLCNTEITVNTNTPPPPPIGYDDYNNPIYPPDYNPNAPSTPIPCIAEKGNIVEGAKGSIVFDEDKIKVTISNQEFTATEFTVYGEVYVVKSIDRTKVINNKGILTIFGQRR